MSFARQLSRKPFTQREVDAIRLRVLLNWTRTVIEQRMHFVGIRHLWFPSRDLDEYEMRTGNPPADVDRPPYLRGLRLEIDVSYIPDAVREAMRPGGKLDQMIQDRLDDSDLDIDPGELRQEIIRRWAEVIAEHGRLA